MRLLLCACLIGCGGDGEVVGDPLVQSTLTGEFDNRPWTAMYGFARSEDDSFILRVGSDKISCADSFQGRPREGTYAATGFSGMTPMTGTFTNMPLNLVEVLGTDPNMQLLTGTLQVTTLTETEVGAVFSFDSTIGTGRFALTGAVTMLRCP